MSSDAETSLDTPPPPPPPRDDEERTPKRRWSKPTVTIFMDLDGTHHGSDPNAAEIQTNPADNYVAS